MLMNTINSARKVVNLVEKRTKELLDENDTFVHFLVGNGSIYFKEGSQKSDDVLCEFETYYDFKKKVCTKMIFNKDGKYDLLFYRAYDDKKIPINGFKDYEEIGVDRDDILKAAMFFNYISNRDKEFDKDLGYIREKMDEVLYGRINDDLYDSIVTVWKMRNEL